MEPGKFITLLDFILCPLYLGAFYAILMIIRNLYYPVGHKLRPYFIPAATVKFVGAIFMCLIYNYYYGMGDTTYYYHYAKIVNSAFSESPQVWTKLITYSGNVYDGDISNYVSQIGYYQSAANYMVVRFAALANLLSFNSFMVSALFFALFSFSGLWALFRCYARKYPHVEKYVAYSILFIPSVFFWGSGISKDALCMFAIGWIIFLVYGFVDLRRFSPTRLLMLAFSIWLVYTIKPYIPISMAIPMVYLLGARMMSNIRATALRRLTMLVFVAVLAVSVPFISSTYSDVLGNYSIDNFVSTSDRFRNNMQSQAASEAGSFYSLGEIEPTTMGMIKKFPQAVNVTLFRPYLWESRSLIMLISALESAAFLFISLKIIYLLGFRRLREAISADTNLQFLLIFTLIFAFSAGITTFNFGTLSRYRIPCMPTFAMALTILYGHVAAFRRSNTPITGSLRPATT